MSEDKRKKPRKGTRSCWECKRRKLRCLFEQGSPADAICIGCIRRGTKCVSQEFPEEISTPLNKARQMRERVVRVEAQLEKLIKKVAHDETPASGGKTNENGKITDPEIPTPVPINSESLSFLAPTELLEGDYTTQSRAFDSCLTLYKLPSLRNEAGGLGKHESLSKVLRESLPSREDIEVIVNARDRVSIFFHEVLTMLKDSLDQNEHESLEVLLQMPAPETHPVLIARYMLLLATFLQHLHPDVYEEINGLSEPPRVIMKRLAETAISLVTKNDELVGNLEGLECIMMEARYQANWGNLRRSLIALRRAIVIAQLMGLHRSAQHKGLDPKTTAHPQSLWFRILFYERHLCLLLGLPQSSLDLSMASKAMLASDTPTGCLERMHCVLSSRILERNEANRSKNSNDYNLTQEIDLELQKAAKILPSTWWLMPNLANFLNDPQVLILNTRRLIDQMFHYNLLNLLHLPHMLRSSAEHKNHYSKIMCVNASREMLTRFTMFRSFNRIATSFRTMDFLALMAGMTLLLAHLDSHQFSQSDNLLAHQCLSDRAMIEQAQENMEEVSRLNTDALSGQSADLLRRLLAIETEMTGGHECCTENMSVSVQTPQAEMTHSGEDNNSVVRVYIPYFGIIKIARESGISKEMPTSQSSRLRHGEDQLTVVDRPTRARPQPHPDQVTVQYSGVSGLNEGSNFGTMIPIEAVGDHCVRELPSILQPVPSVYADMQLQSSPPVSGRAVVPHFAPQFLSSTFDPPLQEYRYPEILAGVEDWALQGVDTAFFDSLMSGADGGNGDQNG